MTKIITIVGARPQFIKAAAVSRAIRDEFFNEIEEIIVHTGQHYDENMSRVFFDEMDIPEPRYNLEISGGGHGKMTGRMLEAIERVLVNEKPQWVLLYGDTNSTLAGALAAAKLNIPIAHVEAGLRSFNMQMPEEINRIVADKLSSLLFCPTTTAVDNLLKEGVVNGVMNVGDVMYDVAMFYKNKAIEKNRIINKLNLVKKKFVIATCHREENTNDEYRLLEILYGLSKVAKILPVVLPIHPRTKKILSEKGLLGILDNVLLINPVSFLDMVALVQSASAVLTDSGGVQKEAFFYGVPCITMRNETEWIETVSLGWNKLVGANSTAIEREVKNYLTSPISKLRSNPYGDGSAAKKIISKILKHKK